MLTLWSTLNGFFCCKSKLFDVILMKNPGLTAHDKNLIRAAHAADFVHAHSCRFLHIQTLKSKIIWPYVRKENCSEYTSCRYTITTTSSSTSQTASELISTQPHCNLRSTFTTCSNQRVHLNSQWHERIVSSLDFSYFARFLTKKVINVKRALFKSSTV